MVRMMQGRWQAAVDIGGTFTDLLLVDRDQGSYAIEKVLTSHGDPERAVSAALDAVLAHSAIRASDVGTIAHATTLVTNAIITRAGPPAALLITAGFRDTLLIGREHRYDMYDVRLQKPEPLVRRRDTFPVPERVLADGTVHRPLDEAAIVEIAGELQRRRIDAVAVCLLHAYRWPQHEIRVREILAECAPRIRVTLSHEVVAELREYERASTTVANAYVLELVDRYLGQLEGRLIELGHAGPFFVMMSNSALGTTDTARRFPVRLVESGPAAGALAAAESGRRMGRADLLSFDMGGTTAKAAIVQGERPTVARRLEVARLKRFRQGSGLPLAITSVELIEIGAGGGSLAHIDPFGLLQVGPDSAGSEPGPVCYARGGTTPTVTDADVVLGYIDPEYFLGGRMRLDPDAAWRAIEQQLSGPLGLDVPRTAWAVHELVNEHMSNAARVHGVERGVDVRSLPLFAFGGAGPVHAVRVARNLGTGLVIVPFGAGVGSAIGLLAAPLAFDFVRTAVAPLAELDWPEVERVVSDMERDGKALLGQSGLAPEQVTVERAVDMRLVGQAHEITVELAGGAPRSGDEARLQEAFRSTYRSLFGRPPPPVAMEIVSWRVRVSGPRPAFPVRFFRDQAPRGDDVRDARKGSRQAYFPESDGFQSTSVYDRYRLLPGMRFDGPAIIEERESTLVIGPDCRASVDDHDNVLVEFC